MVTPPLLLLIGLIMKVADLDEASKFTITFNWFIKGVCWECSLEYKSTPFTHVMLVGNEGEEDTLIVPSCQNHLKKTNNFFNESKRTYLSTQDIFYLKCK